MLQRGFNSSADVKYLYWIFYLLFQDFIGYFINNTKHTHTNDNIIQTSTTSHLPRPTCSHPPSPAPSSLSTTWPQTAPFCFSPSPRHFQHLDNKAFDLSIVLTMEHGLISSFEIYVFDWQEKYLPTNRVSHCILICHVFKYAVRLIKSTFTL